ncbi:LysE family translocator [Sedimentitalea sp. JM2-8]|uniref:LysE family translocator n=1 Tax=Sedimentitalea xiamensis TaxID=3050037 RepID=A0ABT7FAG9_9RHOB|nr:LysE family translocator [Sedimentitalea xiamensis]MDK3072092.1 LysE family translocator [Sedimentitalea xiamensis]
MIDPVAGLAVAGAFLIVTVSPGPANLACAAIAMREGRRPGVAFGIGLSLGLAFWGVLAACGLGAVLQKSESVLAGLKLFGAAYLFWLAAVSARASARPDVPERARPSGDRWIVQGLLLNLSNPKAVFAWMAALAVGLEPSSAAGSVVPATVLCAGIGLANYLMWAALFSVPRVMQGYRHARRRIELALAGIFATAGLGLLRSALSR